MNEQGLEQSLSALMDGEVTELELRRLLRESEDPQLRARWQRWQLAREAMHGRPSPAAVDVSAAVRAAIEQEQQPQVAKPVASLGSKWTKWAVAASVTLAVLGGARLYNSEPMLQHEGLAAASPSSSEKQMAAVVPAPPVVLAGMSGIERQEQGYVPALSRWEQEKLPLYLKSHAWQSGLQSTGGALPHARAASLEGR